MIIIIIALILEKIVCLIMQVVRIANNSLLKEQNQYNGNNSNEDKYILKGMVS